MRTLTAANAIVMLGISSIFNTPQQLQGFAADDIFETDAVTSAETAMGVDGKLSAGFTFQEVRQGYNIQADSVSADMFDTWYLQQFAQRDMFFAFGTAILTSLGKKYTMTKGVLVGYPPMPSAGKILKPRKFGIVWESVVPANT